MSFSRSAKQWSLQHSSFEALQEAEFAGKWRDELVRLHQLRVESFTSNNENDATLFQQCQVWIFGSGEIRMFTGNRHSGVEM